MGSGCVCGTGYWCRVVLAVRVPAVTDHDRDHQGYVPVRDRKQYNCHEDQHNT